MQGNDMSNRSLTIGVECYWCDQLSCIKEVMNLRQFDHANSEPILLGFRHYVCATKTQLTLGTGKKRPCVDSVNVLLELQSGPQSLKSAKNSVNVVMSLIPAHMQSSRTYGRSEKLIRDCGIHCSLLIK